MKNQLLLILLLANLITFGQGTKIVKNVPVVSQDITADTIKYSDSKKEEEVIVNEKDIVLSGNDNKLTFKGMIGKILITGDDNDITIESVKQIVIQGSGNFVSWEKSDNVNGKPIIKDTGGYNNIEKRSRNAQDRSDN